MKNLYYIILVALFFIVINCKIENKIDDEWKAVEEIEKQISEPEFPDTVFVISNYGAIGDGKTINTKAINNTIAICHKAGGGIVKIPEGIFLTGAIHLLSNVNLYLSEKSTLKFSTNVNDYLPVVLTRWEGVDCYNFSPLIYAYQQENIAISGKGILDGQADETNWWTWKGRRQFGWNDTMPSQLIQDGRPLLMEYEKNDTPVEERIFGKENYLRPPFIQIYQCKNILISGVTIKNSPFWIIHPLLSENLIVREIKADSQGPNNDGCDPESCKNVLIENCFFNTGDDCIAIKSGRNNDGRRWNTPSENIIIRNCKMQDGHGGVVIGSEISGGCKNVFVENCVMDSPQLDRAIRIKSNNNRGGLIENIFVRNIKVGEVDEAVIKINCLYAPFEGEGNYPPVIRNIFISDIKSLKSKYALYLDGIDGKDCVYDINIADCDFDGVENKCHLKNVRNIKLEGVKLNKILVQTSD